MLARRPPWLAAYLTVLTIALLTPADHEWHAHRASVWLSIGRDLTLTAIVRDALVNAAIFLPLGMLFHRHVSRAGRRWVVGIIATTLVAAAFSVSIETAQYLLAWRESSLLDVISDTIGAVAGWGIAATVHRLHQRGESRSPVLEEPSVRRAA
jgi:VanZ family protein